MAAISLSAPESPFTGHPHTVLAMSAYVFSTQVLWSESRKTLYGLRYDNMYFDMKKSEGQLAGINLQLELITSYCI